MEICLNKILCETETEPPSSIVTMLPYCKEEKSYSYQNSLYYKNINGNLVHDCIIHRTEAERETRKDSDLVFSEVIKLYHFKLQRQSGERYDRERYSNSRHNEKLDKEKES